MDAPSFTLRPAVIADAARLAELGARIFWDTFAPDNDPEQLRKHLAATFGVAQQASELADPRVRYLIAEVGATTAAYAMIERTTPAGIGAGPAVYLHRFYIDRPWHGRGLAQRLLAAVEAEARGLGGDRLRLTVWERNGRAIAFYLKAGFVDVGTTPYLLGDELQTDRVMEKVLASG